MRRKSHSHTGPIDELPNPAAIAYFSAGQVTDQGRTMT
jgi:hypothetical protein